MRAEPVPEVDPNRYPEIKDRLEGAIKESLTISMPVELVSFGTLPRFELKAKRWLDLRPKE